MWSVKPLSDGFGAEVHGARLGDLTDAQFKELERIFYDRQVLGVRGQTLTPRSSRPGRAASVRRSRTSSTSFTIRSIRTS